MRFELIDYVGCAPEVCDFVFEEAAGEREDAMDELCQLLEEWEVPCVVIELSTKSSKEWEFWCFAVELWDWVDAVAAIVKRAKE